MNKTELINLLQDHLTAIKSLYFPNYASAETLYQRTKMLASKYFASRSYGMDLISVRFHSYSTLLEPEKQAWDNGINKLASIAQAMLDDAALTNVEVPVTKVIEDTSRISQLTEQFNQLKTTFKNNLDEERNKYLQLEIKHKKFQKWILFIILLITLSAFLWIFNYFVKWSWLSSHPKKAALYISFQLLIIFSLARIITSNKTIKIIDILIAIGIAILSII